MADETSETFSSETRIPVVPPSTKTPDGYILAVNQYTWMWVCTECGTSIVPEITMQLLHDGWHAKMLSSIRNAWRGPILAAAAQMPEDESDPKGFLRFLASGD